jgi:hypothetical protein
MKETQARTTGARANFDRLGAGQEGADQPAGRSGMRSQHGERITQHAVGKLLGDVSRKVRLVYGVIHAAGVLPRHHQKCHAGWIWDAARARASGEAPGIGVSLPAERRFLWSNPGGPEFFA